MGEIISINNGNYAEDQLVVPEGVSITSSSQDKSVVRIYPKIGLPASKPFILLSSALPGTQGNQTISYLDIDGIEGTINARAAIKVQNRSNVRIHHCNIHDFTGDRWGYGVYVVSTEVAQTNSWWNYMPEDLQKPGINTNLDKNWPSNPIENFELDNNIITNCGYRESLSGGFFYRAVKLFNLKDSSIHHNTINTLKSRNQALGGVVAFLWNVDIYNNTISQAKYTDRSSYSIEVWLTRGGCEFYNNKANQGFSIDCGKETTVSNNTIIFDPVVKTTGDIGIEFMHQSYGTISGNHIEGSGFAGIDIGLSREHGGKNYTIYDTVIKGNQIYNSNGHGIAVLGIGATSSNTTNTVSGVTIAENKVQKNRNGWSLVKISQANNTGKGIISNVTINYNNISNGLTYAGETVGKVDNISIYNNSFIGNGTNEWKNGYNEIRSVLNSAMPGMVINDSVPPKPTNLMIY